MEKAIAVDPTVYEYDNIYDDLQAKKAASDKRLAPDVDRKVLHLYYCKICSLRFFVFHISVNLWALSIYSVFYAFSLWILQRGSGLLRSVARWPLLGIIIDAYLVYAAEVHWQSAEGGWRA